jgi:hypothetical protein
LTGVHGTAAERFRSAGGVAVVGEAVSSMLGAPPEVFVAFNAAGVDAQPEAKRC